MNDASPPPGPTKTPRVRQSRRPRQSGAPPSAEPNLGWRGGATGDRETAEPKEAGAKDPWPRPPAPKATVAGLAEGPQEALAGPAPPASSQGPRNASPEAPPAAASEGPPAPLPAATAAAAPPSSRKVPAIPDLDAAWAALPVLSLNPRHLKRHLVVTAQRTDPGHGAFDVLRTRVLDEMARRGWRRLGITSPTPGCGKTFTAVNLAVTMSRLVDVRTLLLDLDLRRPAVARVLGASRPGALGDFLRGLVPPEAALARVGRNSLQVGYLALGINARPEPFAAEIFRHARMGEALRAADARLGPDVTIFDLPPVLAQDDVLALRPHYDAILLVAGGGQTTPRELKEAARRLGPDAPILGVVLNKAEGEGIGDYTYGD